MKQIFLYDTHTHTNISPLLDEVDEIVQTCQSKNIIFNVVGTCLKDSLVAIEQAKKYQNTYALIGIHPSEVGNYQDLNQIEELYLKNKDFIKGIGEIGLDYCEGNKDKQLQKQFFIKQLEIANKYDLPICIHVREAEEDCLEILKLVKNPQNVLIHCFAKDWNLAKKYLERGYYLSLNGIITFKKSVDINNCLKFLPLDRIMLETDGPWLTPVPYRGKTNYPYYTEIILEDLSKKLEIQKEKLASQLTKNALNFFRIKDIV